MITGATGTPIANAVTEAHVMQRYLRPDLLDAAGVLDFDSWAATFGQTVTEIEMAPAAAGQYRINTRFAGFQNVPEMLRMWHVFADVKTTADLRLPAPSLWMRDDGRRLPETVLIPASPQIAAYLADLGERAEAVRARRVSSEQDNMLKISTDGRKAALDMRLVGRQSPSSTPTSSTSPPAGSRGSGASTATTLTATAQAPIPRRSPARCISSSAISAPRGRSGTPTTSSAASLSLAAFPASTFASSTGPPAAKRKPACSPPPARARSRCCWAPLRRWASAPTSKPARSPFTTSTVRGVRRTSNSTKAGSCVKVTRTQKSGFTATSCKAALTRTAGRRLSAKPSSSHRSPKGAWSTARSRIADNSLSFAEVKALASGDPLILEKAQADAELTRLARLHRAHQQNQQNLRHTIPAAEQQHDLRSRQRGAVNAAIARRRDTRGERFQMTIAGQLLNTRAEAAARLKAWAMHHARPGVRRGGIDLGPLGELGGLQIDATLRVFTEGSVLLLALHELPVDAAQLPMHQLPEHAISLVRQLEHRIHDLPARAERLAESQQAAAVDAAHARESLRQPFKHADAYAAAHARSAQIADQMRQRQQQPRETRDADPGENLSAIDRASFPAAAVEALTAPRAGARGRDSSRSDLHDRKPGAVRRPDDLQR